MSDLRIEIRKLTMKELFEIRQATGRSLLAELPEKSAAAFDEQMLAALVWTVRRRSEPDLTFEEVFSTLEWGQTAKSGGEVVIDLDSNPLVATGSTTRKRSPRSAGSTRPRRVS